MTTEVKNKLGELGNRFMQLVQTTPIEVPIFAVAGALMVGYYGYRENVARSGERPVSFSEVGKIKRLATARGEPLSPIQLAAAHCNDGLAKVNEANNLAYDSGGDHDDFARELEFKLSPSLKIFRLISDEARDTQANMPGAMKSLEKYSAAMTKLPPVMRALDAAWSAEHDDKYKYVPCTETYTDSKGKTHTRMTTCRKYSHTVHTYRYNMAAATKANTLLSSYLAEHPDMKIADKLVLGTETDVHNEYAIERSFRRDLKGAIPTPEQNRTYANIYVTASNFNQLRGPIEQIQNDLHPLSKQWQSLYPTEHYHQYTTHSSSDSGPPGYRLANALINKADGLEMAARQVVGGLQACNAGLQQIVGMSKEYIAIVKDGKPGNADALRTQILDTQANSYKAFFAKGPEQDPFSYGEVMLYAFGGLVGFGVLGWGVDAAGNALLRRRRPQNSQGNNYF